MAAREQLQQPVNSNRLRQPKRAIAGWKLCTLVLASSTSEPSVSLLPPVANGVGLTPGFVANNVNTKGLDNGGVTMSTFTLDGTDLGNLIRLGNAARRAGEGRFARRGATDHGRRDPKDRVGTAQGERALRAQIERARARHR